MLSTLKIRNFALIEEAEIPFEPGLNILSGETGAGKSIILNAISLLLGGRGSAEVIRTGSDEAIVEGIFETDSMPFLAKRMNDLGMSFTGGDLLIKRTFSKNGKNKIYINGELASLQVLSKLCEDLIDLCGQHEHQSLFKSSVQLDLVDQFGKLSDQVKKLSALARELSNFKSEYESLRAKEEERTQRLDFLRFQFQELEAAQLSENEEESLLEEKKLLQSSELRRSLSMQVDDLLNAESGASGQIRLAHQKLRQLIQSDPSLSDLLQGLDRAVVEVEEVSHQIARYLSRVEGSPERFDEVQERLSLLIQLKRKYGASLKEVLMHMSKCREEISILENLTNELSDREQRIEILQNDLTAKAQKLFSARQESSKRFSDAINKELKELKMSDSKCHFEYEFQDQNISPETLGCMGGLWVQTNAGDAPKPLNKIVSGGELSRLMLSIRRVISDRGSIGVYLFDEIDAGLGGQTAFVVGKKLKSVAKHHQVICITHVPQVACFADHHLSITKQTQKGRTLTQVQVLDAHGSREEIARMLGADKVTPSSLKNAKELIDSATL